MAFRHSAHWLFPQRETPAGCEEETRWDGKTSIPASHRFDRLKGGQGCDCAEKGFCRWRPAEWWKFEPFGLLRVCAAAARKELGLYQRLGRATGTAGKLLEANGAFCVVLFVYLYSASRHGF